MPSTTKLKDYTALLHHTIKLSHPPLTPSPTSTTAFPRESLLQITLNRPSKLNAFTPQMQQELCSVLSTASSDPRVRAIILTGEGKRAFCAGADLEEGILEPRQGPPGTHRDEGGKTSLAILQCNKPVIAAIQGSAVGIGITMTLPCTIRLAARTAKIAFPFVRRGLVPEAASAFFLPRLIGYSKALHLLSTGETVRADSPLLDGLFSEVLETPEAVMQRAVELGSMLATQTSAVSGWLVYRMVWRGAETPEDAHLLDSALLEGLFKSKDKEEGIKSFLEKREPRYTDKLEDLPGRLAPWWKETDIKPKL